MDRPIAIVENYRDYLILVYTKSGEMLCNIQFHGKTKDTQIIQRIQNMYPEYEIHTLLK